MIYNQEEHEVLTVVEMECRAGHIKQLLDHFIGFPEVLQWFFSYKCKLISTSSAESFCDGWLYKQSKHFNRVYCLFEFKCGVNLNQTRSIWKYWDQENQLRRCFRNTRVKKAIQLSLWVWKDVQLIQNLDPCDEKYNSSHTIIL